MLKNIINITGYVSFVKNSKTKNNKNFTSFSLGFYNGKDKKSGYIPIKYMADTDAIYRELQKAAQKDSKLKAEVTGVLREDVFEDKKYLYVFANQIAVFEDSFKEKQSGKSIQVSVATPVVAATKTSVKSQPVVNTTNVVEENTYPF